MKYKKIKNFKGKKSTIRSLSKSDLKSPKKFQVFINSLIKEDAQVGLNRKVSLKEELNWIKGVLKKEAKRQSVYLVAEHEGKIVGSIGINSLMGRENHVANFGIAIRKDYRRISLGESQTARVISK